MINFKHFAKAASVAAMTVGVAFAATPAQKASAQVVGAGASSITTLAQQVRGQAGQGLVDSQGNPLTETRFTGFGTRYVVTGSGAGRTAFLAGQTSFAATDGLSTLAAGVASGQFVAFQETFLNVAFPYNLPGYNGAQGDGRYLGLRGADACRVLRGDFTNWNQIQITSVDANGNPIDADGNVVPLASAEVLPGPTLPIIRVARGDSSGTTDTLNGLGFTSNIPGATPRARNGANVRPAGFIDACNADPVTGNLSATPFFTPINTSNTLIGILNSGTDVDGFPIRSNNFFDGTNIPNRKPFQDILVDAATTADASGNPQFPGSPFNPGPVDPFGAASASGDDDNASTTQGAYDLLGNTNPGNFVGSYTLGIINAVSANAGAIGYTETAATRTAIATGAIGGLATAVDTPGAPTSIIAVGPTFVVFNATGNAAADLPALRNACRALTDSDNLAAAGFSAAEINAPLDAAAAAQGPSVSGGNPNCDTAIN